MERTRSDLTVTAGNLRLFRSPSQALYERLTKRSFVQKITSFIWFAGNAEAAATFYVSIFPNSRIVKSGPMMVEFEIDG